MSTSIFHAEASSTAAPVERTAILAARGEIYTLKLIARTGNERQVKKWIIHSKTDEFHEDLVWLDQTGDDFKGTYNMVTKGSTFVFEGNQYPVEDPTPFETKPPGNGENYLELLRVFKFPSLKRFLTCHSVVILICFLSVSNWWQI